MDYSSRAALQEQCGLSVNVWRLWMACFVFVLRRMVHHRNSVVLPASLIQPALKKCLTLRQEVILGVRKLFIKWIFASCPQTSPEVSRSIAMTFWIAPKVNHVGNPRHRYSPSPPGYPTQWLHTDIVGPLQWTKSGSHFMLTVQCSLTKWAKACAMPNQRVSMVTVFQERRIRQDPQLTIRKGNGQVDNLHRTMESMLTARTEERSVTWDEQ